jgi:aspartyl protease family protein
MRAVVIWVLMLGGLGALAGQFRLPPQSASASASATDKGRIEVVQSAPQVAERPQFRSEEGSIALDRAADGHFYADVRINGTIVHMLIDTGASGVALSRDDARAVGLPTSIGMNDTVGQGADGAIHGEYARLERVELGPLTATGLDAIVLNSGQQSLLGQSFLSRFSSVQIANNQMVLR